MEPVTATWLGRTVTRTAPGVYDAPDGGLRVINLEDNRNPGRPGVRVLTQEEWLKEAASLFGRDPRKWKFRCVKCRGVQTIQDFLDAGISEEEALKRVHFSCIGRWVKGRGCDWTLGGLFQVHKVEVIVPGRTEPTMSFEFATDDSHDPAGVALRALLGEDA